MTTIDYRGFKLRFVRDPAIIGAIRVYLLGHPNPFSNAQPADLADIHLIPPGHDGYPHPPYIAFVDVFAPRSLDAAMEMGRRWVDQTLAGVTTEPVGEHNHRDQFEEPGKGSGVLPLLLARRAGGTNG